MTRRARIERETKESKVLVEAQFKAFARAFRDAVAIDPRESGIPSTKGAL